MKMPFICPVLGYNTETNNLTILKLSQVLHLVTGLVKSNSAHLGLMIYLNTFLIT